MAKSYAALMGLKPFQRGKKKSQYLCGFCREPGHRRHDCPRYEEFMPGNNTVSLKTLLQTRVQPPVAA